MDLARPGSCSFSSRALPFFSALSSTYSSATFRLLLASAAADDASEGSVPASCRAQSIFGMMLQQRHLPLAVSVQGDVVSDRGVPASCKHQIFFSILRLHRVSCQGHQIAARACLHL